MSYNEIDTNVSNYTFSELMAIVGLDDLDPKEITKKTNFFIKKYKNSNPTLSSFFQSIQSQLLQYEGSIDNPNVTAEDDIPGPNDIDENEQIYPIGEKQTINWYKNEYQKQPKNPVQNDKITDRKQKIDVYYDDFSAVFRG